MQNFLPCRSQSTACAAPLQYLTAPVPSNNAPLNSGTCSKDTVGCQVRELFMADGKARKPSSGCLALGPGDYTYAASFCTLPCKHVISCMVKQDAGLDCRDHVPGCACSACTRFAASEARSQRCRDGWHSGTSVGSAWLGTAAMFPICEASARRL